MSWLDNHSQAVVTILGSAATFVLTVIVALLLWDRIGDVAEEVRTLRTEVSNTRALDSSRIESVANRLDASATRLDTILDESKASKQGVNELLAKSDKQGERLATIEKIIASGVTDMSVVLRLITGETSNFSLTNFATNPRADLTQQSNLSTVKIAAKLYHGGELRLYPPSPDVANILKANGWQAIAADDPSQGFIFRP